MSGSLIDRTAGIPKIDLDRPLPIGIHVWVRGSTGEVPGLLAGWRNGADGWWGRVVTVSDGQSSESLFRAGLLRKA